MLRIAKRWTQEKLAEEAGCSKRTIENAEAGKRIKENILEDIAEALGVPFSDLVVGDNGKRDRSLNIGSIDPSTFDIIDPLVTQKGLGISSLELMNQHSKIVETTKVLIMLVEKLIVRLEFPKKQTNEPVELKQALLDLVHGLHAWWRCAKMTDFWLEKWLENGSPPDQEFRIRLRYQRDTLDRISSYIGYPFPDTIQDEGLKHVTVMDALFVYDPEIEKLIRETMDFRIKKIKELEEEFDRYGANGAGVQKAISYLTGRQDISISIEIDLESLNSFKKATSDIRELTKRLAQFIRTRYITGDFEVWTFKLTD